MNLRKELAKKGKFLRAADLDGRPMVAVVEGVEREEVGQERELKHVLHFRDRGIKPLILNAINSDTLIDLLGPETADWDGESVELYPTETTFQGKRVDCIRIRAPKAQTRMEPIGDDVTEISF